MTLRRFAIFLAAFLIGAWLGLRWFSDPFDEPLPVDLGEYADWTGV